MILVWESDCQNTWGSGWDIIGWLVGLGRSCNDYNRLGLGDRKVVGILLALLMGLDMMRA